MIQNLMWDDPNVQSDRYRYKRTKCLGGDVMKKYLGLPSYLDLIDDFFWTLQGEGRPDVG